MTCGYGTAQDIPALRRLWMNCFGDDAAYVDQYFQGFQENRIFVLRYETRISAMAISFPVGYRSFDGTQRQGAYLYAVCTAAADRGKGFCKMLLTYAEEQLLHRGCNFLCLKAASTDLTRMYEKLGYRTTFFSTEHLVSAAYNGEKIQEISPQRYNALRQRLLSGGYVTYPVETLTHQARLGALLEITTDSMTACAAVERYGGVVTVKEYLGDLSHIRTIPAYFGTSNAKIRTPGNELPFAMAKPLGNTLYPGGYLGLAFD